MLLNIQGFENCAEMRRIPDQNLHVFLQEIVQFIEIPLVGQSPDVHDKVLHGRGRHFRRELAEEISKIDAVSFHRKKIVCFLFVTEAHQRYRIMSTKMPQNALKTPKSSAK